MRACAFTQLENDGGVVDATQVLSMLYANGLGVRANIALAQKFECDSALPSRDGLNFLQAVKEGVMSKQEFFSRDSDPFSQHPFDSCNWNARSYVRDAVCESRLQEKEARAYLKKLVLTLTPEQKIAFEKLQKAKDNFFEKRINEEVGVEFAHLNIEHRTQLEAVFLEQLKAFEKYQFPQPDSEEDFKRADITLNAQYRETLKRVSNSLRPTPEGVKKAEHVWLKYRDAWVTFSKLRYPQVKSNAWRIYFTKERTEMLEELRTSDLP